MADENEGSTELVKTERGTLKARDMKIGSAGINFTNAAEVMAFANMMASAGPAVRKQFRGEPGACLAIVDDAIRFGMSPFFLARKAYMVNDEIAYEAQVIAAIITARAPIKDRADYEFSGEGQTRKCRVSVVTTSGKTITHDSPQIKDIKVKNSPLWASDPDQQLGYYTVRAMARRHFPDILGGIYDIEEAAAARARDITPAEPEERPKSKLGEMLTAGADAKAKEIQARATERPKEAPAAETAPKEPVATENAPAGKSEAWVAVGPEPEADAEVITVDAAKPGAEKIKGERTPAPEWPEEDQEVLDRLIAALAAVESLEGLDPVQGEFGALMKGKPKAFVAKANDLLTARREELTPKKESAAKKLL